MAQALKHYTPSGAHYYTDEVGGKLNNVTTLLKAFEDHRLLDRVPEARRYITVWPKRPFVESPATLKGKEVHSWAERFILTGGEAGPALLEEEQGFMDWWHKGEVEFFSSEEILFDMSLRLAGTLDTTCRVRIPQNLRYLTDFKTGRKIYGTTWLQLGAYWKMIRPGRVDGTACLHLKDDGSFEFVTVSAAKSEELGNLFLKLLRTAREMRLV